MDVQGSSDNHVHGNNCRWQLCFPYLSALAVLILASHVVWNYQKLSGFSGSPWAAVSSIPHRLAILSGNSHLFYAQANQKYGKRECDGGAVYGIYNMARDVDKPCALFRTDCAGRPKYPRHIFTGCLGARQ